MKNLIHKKIKRILFLWMLLLCHKLSFAQGSRQGIYLSADDFNIQKISFAPVPGKKYKIHLNETFYKPTVKIIIGDSTFALKKDAVFGYRDNENSIHRFYDKIDYVVMNPSESILLYSRTHLGGFHNSQTIVEYYFSANADAAVRPLTKWDIKNAFPNDSAFHELLDMYFHRDNDLLAYDNFYKMYKLNRVFQLSQQMNIKNK